jgi:branched-chain amino acid transport system ATP-binding protein
MAEPLLDIRNLKKSFGGLQATNDVSLHVNHGELVSIIGPNGAGKSTLFNQITGYIQPNSGEVLFDGRSVLGKTPYQIVRLGIGRAFQRSNIFPRLTVFENVQAAVISHQRKILNFWSPARSLNAVNNRAGEILQSVGLYPSKDRRAGTMALGDQKRLEIALALALEPRLLLLDEPTAGMSPEETNSIVALIERLVHEFEVTLLFTEHDISLVFSISKRIYVLNYGTIIAEGLPSEIAANPHVQEVYLGTSRPKSQLFAD